MLNKIKNLSQTAILVAACLVTAGVTSIALTAIVTRYEGAIDVQVGPSGGQLKIEGRSASRSLPSVDAATPPAKQIDEAQAAP
jgi:hypothetical protein